MDDDASVMDDNALELDMLVDMIEKYEEVHYPTTIIQRSMIRMPRNAFQATGRKRQTD